MLFVISDVDEVLVMAYRWYAHGTIRQVIPALDGIIIIGFMNEQ